MCLQQSSQCVSSFLASFLQVSKIIMWETRGMHSEGCVVVVERSNVVDVGAEDELSMFCNVSFCCSWATTVMSLCGGSRIHSQAPPVRVALCVLLLRAGDRNAETTSGRRAKQHLHRHNKDRDTAGARKRTCVLCVRWCLCSIYVRVLLKHTEMSTYE